jgi:hypothetical protein
MLFMNPEIITELFFKYVAQINIICNILYSLHYLQGGLVSDCVRLTFPINSFPYVQGSKIFVLTSHLFSNMITRSLKNYCKQTLAMSR